MVYNEYINRKSNSSKRTGIKCFDTWRGIITVIYITTQECGLQVFGFSLESYNWQSEQIFEKNLLDFCPASNTLGWRWVAGLQTTNKPYLAKSNNIQYFTNGRFYPKGQLNENVSLSFPNPNQNKTQHLKNQKFYLIITIN